MFFRVCHLLVFLTLSFFIRSTSFLYRNAFAYLTVKQHFPGLFRAYLNVSNKFPFHFCISVKHAIIQYIIIERSHCCIFRSWHNLCRGGVSNVIFIKTTVFDNVPPLKSIATANGRYIVKACFTVTQESEQHRHAN